MGVLQHVYEDEFMRTSLPFTTVNSLEMLEMKLSPTSLSAGGIIAKSMISAVSASPADDDDPPPEPAPVPPPNPGDNPPIVYPLAPPSGPAGPGS
jgi:hypothetical protein